MKNNKLKDSFSQNSKLYNSSIPHLAISHSWNNPFKKIKLSHNMKNFICRNWSWKNGEPGLKTTSPGQKVLDPTLHPANGLIVPSVKGCRAECSSGK
jgi:hypothetical protein